MSFLLGNFRADLDKFSGSGDPRVSHLPLMQSPVPVLTILAAYLLFVLKVGPDMMRKKEPYNIKKTIMYYNVLQVIFNFLGVIAGIVAWPYVNVQCTPLDTRYLAIYHYLYFLLKGFDLLDTIFFVLRKKFNQISFLHLYHHTVMLVGTWVTCKYIPGGQLYFLGFVNVFVHILVYFYYFLTSWNPKYRGSIWWKRNLTQIQIAQHCFVFCVLTLPLLNQDCTYPKFVLAGYLPAVALMIYLFTDFYIQAYVKKTPQKKVATQ